MTLRLGLLLALLPLPLSAAKVRRSHPPAGLPIASIKIETNNVFDTSRPPENKLAYRAANGLHIRTHEHVIERELLFAVGDPYDPLLIEETERNLRTLPFLRRAEITSTPNGTGGVDVVVRTYDAWTLEVVAGFKRAGGVTNLKAGLAEHNILGEGKSGSAVYSRDGTVASKAFSYSDRAFLHQSRLQYSMAAVDAPGVRQYSIALNRPFYASIARNAYGGGANYSAARTGSETRGTGEAFVNYGIALATSTERTRRLNFGLLTHRALTTGAVPDLQQLTYFKLGAEWQELDFITARRIQNFTRDEDFNLGLGVIPSVAWAPMIRVLGTTESQINPRVDVTKGFAWSSQLLLLKSGVGSSYVNGGNGNRVASFDAAYFVRGLRYQTLAFHTGVDVGYHLAPDGLLTLGELNGLRGYGLGEFSGNRRFLFNIEDRIYVYDDLFRILDVGAVAFYDAGNVWAAPSPIKAGDLKSSVGLGLRVAPSRSGSNSPVRIDIAHPFNAPPGRSAWALSILAGQAF